MRRLLSVLLIINLLFLSQLATPSTTLAGTTVRTVTIGIDNGHSDRHTSLQELSNLTTVLATGGAQVLYANGMLNQSFLNRVDALLISSPMTSIDPFELAALASWYRTGGRLWLSSSSDGPPSIQTLNTILRAINSELGFEAGYISDPIFNLNASAPNQAEVLIPIINHKAGLPTRLTSNLRTIYAHEPIPIIAYNGSSYLKYNADAEQNTTWIAETTSTARVTNSSNTPLLTYISGETARFTTVVVEEQGRARLVLSGTPFFSQWEHSFEYNQNQPYDNRLLVKNLLNWLTGYEIQTRLEADIPDVRGTGQPQILIYTGAGSQRLSESEIQPLRSILSDMGFRVTTFENISSTAITNATAIIIQAPGIPFTPSEGQTIDKWLQQKNKTLILASMTDYILPGGAAPFSTSLNNLLQDLGSVLRFETGSISDPEVNMAGNAYVGLTSLINHGAPTVANLTKNIRSLYMQFGTTLIASNNTPSQSCCYYPLENQTYLESLTNVTWIARTSNVSAVFDLDPAYPLLAHSQNQKGSYIVAAQEIYRNASYNSKILLLSGPILSDFSRLLQYPSIYGYPTDNLLFIRNIFTGLLTSSQVRTEIKTTPFQTEILEDGQTTFNTVYSALQTSTENLSEVDRTPIAPANLTLTLTGTVLHPSVLPNQTYTVTGTPTGTGAASWSVSASAAGYQPQTVSGTIQVNPRPDRFTVYVLSIPIAIFIAVALAVFARKAR